MHVASHLVTNSMLAGMVIRREIAHWAEKIPHFCETILGRSIIIIYCMRYKKNICIYIIMWVWIYPSKDSIYFRKAWFRRFSKGYLQFTFWRQMQTAYIPEGWTRQRPYRMSWRSKCNLAVEEKLQCLQMGKLGLVKYVNQLIQSDLCIPQLEVT